MLLQLEELMGEAWKFSKTNSFSSIGKNGQNCAFMFSYLESVKYSVQIEMVTLDKCRPRRKICHFSS